MATYLILNILFLAVVAGILHAKKVLHPTRQAAATLLILLVLTALFDSLIIAAGIVAYDPSKLLGLTIGRAPIEDFFYCFLAILIVPSLWHFAPKGQK